MEINQFLIHPQNYFCRQNLLQIVRMKLLNRRISQVALKAKD